MIEHGSALGAKNIDTGKLIQTHNCRRSRKKAIFADMMGKKHERGKKHGIEQTLQINEDVTHCSIGLNAYR